MPPSIPRYGPRFSSRFAGSFVAARRIFLPKIRSHKTTASRYFTWGDEPEFTQLYIDKYAKLNPMFPGALFFNVEEVHQLIEIIPREEVRRTRFCIEWMAPQEIIDDMFAILEKSATSCSLFQVIRRRRDEVVDDDARERLALLAPHIRRSVLIGKIIDLKKVEAAALADSLDTLSAGMFMVDASGRIVHANASGHSMLAEAKVLRSVGGHLGAIDSLANQALLESFAATESGDPGTRPQGHSGSAQSTR